jgi:hypothetical protein
MDRFSMAMGITLLNKAALSTMTLAQVEWDVSQKVKSNERNEIKRRVWTSCNPWQCKGGPGPNPLCS